MWYAAHTASELLAGLVQYCSSGGTTYQTNNRIDKSVFRVEFRNKSMKTKGNISRGRGG